MCGTYGWLRSSRTLTFPLDYVTEGGGDCTRYVVRVHTVDQSRSVASETR